MMTCKQCGGQFHEHWQRCPAEPKRDCPHGRQIGKCADCDVIELEAECERLRELVGDYICKINEEKKGLVSQVNMTSAARRERDALRAELAITRRVIDRIDQLCTTPHESKERFIRRVQSVIEWQTAAQQDQPK